MELDVWTAAESEVTLPAENKIFRVHRRNAGRRETAAAYQRRLRAEIHAFSL